MVAGDYFDQAGNVRRLKMITGNHPTRNLWDSPQKEHRGWFSTDDCLVEPLLQLPPLESVDLNVGGQQAYNTELRVTH